MPDMRTCVHQKPAADRAVSRRWIREKNWFADEFEKNAIFIYSCDSDIVDERYDFSDEYLGELSQRTQHEIHHLGWSFY